MIYVLTYEIVDRNTNKMKTRSNVISTMQSKMALKKGHQSIFLISCSHEVAKLTHSFHYILFSS